MGSNRCSRSAQRVAGRHRRVACATQERFFKHALRDRWARHQVEWRFLFVKYSGRRCFGLFDSSNELPEGDVKPNNRRIQIPSSVNKNNHRHKVRKNKTVKIADNRVTTSKADCPVCVEDNTAEI